MTPSEASADLPLPTFLIIGAQKSATRWLRFNLGQDPDVFVAPYELSFFNDDARFGLGERFYRTQFHGWGGEAVVGESTPGYLMWQHEPATVADRIGSVVPDVRLIAVLRNPVDRALSARRHHIDAERFRPSVDIATYARGVDPDDDPLGIVSGGWYAASLAPYVERFGDQLLVLLHDDIGSDPAAVYAVAARHVGASADFVPPDLERVRNSNRRAPARPGGVADEAELSVAGRRSLYDEFFRADVERLEGLIDRDLSCWAPA